MKHLSNMFARTMFNRRLVKFSRNSVTFWKIAIAAATIAIACYIAELKWRDKPEDAKNDALQTMEEPMDIIDVIDIPGEQRDSKEGKVTPLQSDDEPVNKPSENVVEEKQIYDVTDARQEDAKNDAFQTMEEPMDIIDVINIPGEQRESKDGKVMPLQSDAEPVNKPSENVVEEKQIYDVTGKEILEMYQKEHESELNSMKEFMISITEAAKQDFSQQDVSLEQLKEGELKFVKRGGRIGSMTNFNPRHVVAVIIPVRSSDQSKLSVLLRNLLPILHKKTDLHARIFVVEQTDSLPFNAGALLNIGYKEAMKLFHFSCFVFHPTTVVPLSADTPYGCESSPMQLVVSVQNRIDPFVRVDMVTERDFVDMNGYPTDRKSEYMAQERFYKRAKDLGKIWHRPTRDVGVFASLANGKDLLAEATNVEQARRQASLNVDQGGLGHLRYHVDFVRNKPLFTLVATSMIHEEQREELSYVDAYEL